MTEQVVIVDGVRTPRGKGSSRGALHSVSPVALVTQLIRALIQRGLVAADVDDFVLGCATQCGEQGQNLARAAGLLSGLGPAVPAVTVNRFCASGLEAINLGRARIVAGDARVVLAGGVESVSRVPMFSDGGVLYSDSVAGDQLASVHMGIAADLIATREGFTREALDAYSGATRQRARTAHAQGRGADSIVPVVNPAGTILLCSDEHLSYAPSAQEMSELAPSFVGLGASGHDARVLARYPELGAVRHLHTRASSPALADGAALLVLAGEATARERALRARARIVATATVASDPVVMLTAGQAAIEVVLDKAGLTTDDLDVVEFAEAFAAGCLRLARDLRLGPERLNPNGGTIALGHAFGATGAVLLLGVVDELERRDGRYGVAAVSAAAGLGVATLIERI